MSQSVIWSSCLQTKQSDCVAIAAASCGPAPRPTDPGHRVRRLSMWLRAARSGFSCPTVNKPEPCAWGINTPWPWPVRSASSSTPSPASPTRDLAGRLTDSTAGTTARIRGAVSCSRPHSRLLRQLLDADQRPKPTELRRAASTVERVLGDYVTRARLGAAARNVSQEPEVGGPTRASLRRDGRSHPVTSRNVR